MTRYNQIYTRRPKRKESPMRISDLASKKQRLNELMNGGVNDVEIDFAWFLHYKINRNKQTEDVICGDQNVNGNANENGNGNENEKENVNSNENESENEDEDEDEDEVVHVDANDKDPDYCMFLENLTEHGKSYKLKISQNDEEPRFLYYEEQVSSDWCDDLQTCIDDSGDEVTISEDTQQQKAKRMPNAKNGQISTKKEVSRRKESNDHKSTAQDITFDPCYSKYLNGAVKCEEGTLEDEKNVTTSDSDSDVVILDNVQSCGEVKNKQLVLAEIEPSLRQKLIHILKHPYNEKEYQELIKYIKQEKPVCIDKPLRNGRSRSFTMNGVKKSVLDYGPKRFRSMLNAAQKDPPKALNLLRMFRFWLEHVPHLDAFQPWRDRHILKVRPSEKNAATHMQ